MRYSYTLALLLALNVYPAARVFAATQPHAHTASAPRRVQTAPVAASSSVNDYYSELGQSFTWPATKMPLHVYIRPATGIAGYKPEFGQILQSSFDEWADASNGRVRFVFTDKSAEADMEVEWMRNLPRDAVAHEIGVTSIHKEGNGSVKKSHTILLTVNVDGHPMLDFNVRQAALHELGHAIGIQGHSLHPPDIMTLQYNFLLRRNPDGSIVPVNGDPHLTSRDKGTLLRLYTDQWASASGVRTASIAPIADAQLFNNKPGSAQTSITPQVATALPAVTPHTASTAPVFKPAAAAPITPPAAAEPPLLPQVATTVPTVSPPPSIGTTAPALVPTTQAINPAAPRPTSSQPFNQSADLDATLGMLPVETTPAAAAQPSQYVALVRSGVDSIKRGDFDNAITTLNQATNLGDTSKTAEKNLIVALTSKANKLYAAHDYGNSAENYKSAISLRLKVNGVGDPKIAETAPAFFYCLRQSGQDQELTKWKWLAH